MFCHLKRRYTADGEYEAAMKRYLVIFFLILIAAVQAQTPKPAADKKAETLTGVIENMETMKGIKLSLELRLRNVDAVMEKVWFYDRDNIDIVFDITGYKKNAELLSCFEDAHAGVLYRVEFMPAAVMQDGVPTGTLVSFVPVFLDKLK